MLARLALLAVTTGFASAQAPPAQAAPPQRHVDLTRSYALELPAGWRQLTPDEAFALSRAENEIPAELLSPRQAEYYPYGAIDRWLAGDFDGRCMTTASRRGEIPTDASGVEALRRHAAKVTRETGWEQEILSAEITEIGPGAHPAVVCRTRIAPPGEPAVEALVLCVPTGGDTLILSFRALEPDFAAALPVFERAAATLTFARPARGSSDEVTTRLLYPAVVGACIGLLLLILRRKAVARV